MIRLLNKSCDIVNIPDDKADEYNTVCLAHVQIDKTNKNIN